MDADGWSVVWAVFAVIAGSGLAIAASTLGRHLRAIDQFEFDGGYNALATVADR
jgi:hypothetical protein